MRNIVVLFAVVLLIAFADAQRKPKITKPVVNLEKRLRPPIWNRPPEERRKLSIFPRNNVKFVVTPKAEVNNEDAANQGLPMTTKRPLVRKFTMHDRNKKRTWSFAPREPLMKTNRFTVTMTPPISSNRKATDEMKSEESNKLDTVIRSLNPEQPSSKKHKLNKGNLVEMMQIKDMELSKPKHSEKVEEKFIEEETSQIIKENDTNDFETIRINDNTSKLYKVSKNYPIDIRRLNNEDVIVSTNETENEHGSVKLNQTAENTGLMKDFLESRAVDLNERKYAIEQHESNSLTMDNEESNNTAQVLSFNDLEIVLEKNVNNTELTTGDFDEKPSNSPKNETKDTSEDIPEFDVTIPNEYYDVISLSTNEANKTNSQEDKQMLSSVLHGPIIANEEKCTASETNILNGEDFTEHVADSLVVGNPESLINYKDDTNGYESHQKGIVTESEETKTNTRYTLTEKPFTNYPTNDSINNFTNDIEYENKTEFPRELNSNKTESFNSTEISLEIYESNMSLSSGLPDELITELPNESATENVSLTIVEIPNEAFIESVHADEILKETISDASNGYTEERSNESSIDISTGEEISNESSSNMVGEELNESSSFIEEIPNEYVIESSNNFTGEEISNESSSNMAAEEISNESYPDKSNNLTEEGASEYIVETSNNFTGEEISNESSSNMATEEISNESHLDKSSNLTEESASEYIIETSNNSTGEVISNESSSNMAVEEISNESYPDKSSNLTEEGASEYNIETSNNFTGQEISNESSSNMATEVISNESDKLYWIEKNSSGSTTEISQSSIVEETYQASDIIIDEKISDRSVGSSLHPEISEEALANRFKRHYINSTVLGVVGTTAHYHFGGQSRVELYRVELVGVL